MVYIIEHFDYSDVSYEDRWIGSFAFSKLEDAQNYLEKSGFTANQYNKMKYESAYHTAIITKLFLYDFKED